jgi:hypothetical protein
MKTKHLFEDQIYLIGNHSCARNPLFATEKMQDYFKNKMEKYLSPLCDIMAYNLNDNEFQIVVKLNERKAFEEHFLSKKKNKDKEVPETTYIFSQAMANLQVSFVKHFNFVFNRSGGLIARRFHRHLIESEEELHSWVTKLNNGEKLHSYAKMWMNDLMRSGKVMTGKWIYEDGVGEENQVYVDFKKLNLVGQFEILPPYQLPFKKYEVLSIFKSPFTPENHPQE